MYKIKTETVIGALGMAGQAGIMEHLMNNDTEILNTFFKTIMGGESEIDTSKVYVLWGCVNSTPGGGTFTIGAGAIAAVIDTSWQFFTVDAVTITPGGGNTVVAVKNQDQYIALDGGGFKKGDPVEFNDGTPRNVLDIFTIELEEGASGSGITGDINSDYGNLIFIRRQNIDVIDHVISDTFNSALKVIHSFTPSATLSSARMKFFWSAYFKDNSGGVGTQDVRIDLYVNGTLRSSSYAYMIDQTGHASAALIWLDAYNAGELVELKVDGVSSDACTIFNSTVICTATDGINI